MIKPKEIEECIDFIFDHIKNSIFDNKIKFSRIEKYEFENRIQWLLSIVLVKEYTESEIDEIVLESNLIIVENEYKVNIDLSYGNGVILKDDFTEISIGLNKKNTLKHLQNRLFNGIDSEILIALNRLVG
jgi:hypothetical protein